MRVIIFLLLLVMSHSIVYADTLIMKDGSILKGQVESQEGKSIFFKTFLRVRLKSNGIRSVNWRQNNLLKLCW